MTNSKSRCVIEISTDTRPIVYLTIDRLSTDCRLTIDRLSTDYRRTIDRLSTDFRPPVDRLSTVISTAMSTTMLTDILVDITQSKQDPRRQHSALLSINCTSLWSRMMQRAREELVRSR